MKTICEKETEKSTHHFGCLSAVFSWKSGKNRSDIISISLYFNDVKNGKRLLFTVLKCYFKSLLKIEKDAHTIVPFHPAKIKC